MRKRVCVGLRAGENISHDSREKKWKVAVFHELKIRFQNKNEEMEMTQCLRPLATLTNNQDLDPIAHKGSEQLLVTSDTEHSVATSIF